MERYHYNRFEDHYSVHNRMTCNVQNVCGRRNCQIVSTESNMLEANEVHNFLTVSIIIQRVKRCMQCSVKNVADGSTVEEVLCPKV